MAGVQKNLTKKPYEYIYLTKYHLFTMAGQIQVSSVSSKPSYFGECWHTQSDDRQNDLGRDRSKGKWKKSDKQNAFLKSWQ